MKSKTSSTKNKKSINTPRRGKNQLQRKRESRCKITGILDQHEYNTRTLNQIKRIEDNQHY